MATTWIKPLHIGKGRSVAAALSDSIDYMANPYKTDKGEWISSYECDARTADNEFLLSKQQYASLTGRSQGKKDVIAYHVRQSFKPAEDGLPGETNPEEANRIGYELAMRFTKGKYAFIVCTHTDKAHIHNHIIWNSTALDCKRKFRNFIGSSFALRRCSDLLCAENGLSVIENPKPSPGRDYARYMFESKPLSYQERLRFAIDTALEKNPTTFEDFLTLMRAVGYEVNDKRKHITFKLPEQKQPTRCDTLRGNYTEAAIRERIARQRISGTAFVPVRSTELPVAARHPSLLIDIQAKLQEGKGAGYERWAKLHNLKQMAQTLIYLQEKGLDDYSVLKEKTASATARFNELSERLKELEAELSDNAAMQKHIVNYSKTRQTYIDYRKAGYSKKFKELHEADIIIHQTAKNAFDRLGVKKLPTVASLRAEYAPLLEEKKHIYKEYKEVKTEMRELLTAKTNVDRLFNTSGQGQERGTERQTFDERHEIK